ncbi:MAG: alcohol dehydrogenase catalytic domain-containing protein [Nitrososphaeria archaeon]
MQKFSRSAVLSEPGKIELKEFPIPEISEDTALIKIIFSGICGTDQHMYKGEKVLDTYYVDEFKPIPFPIIPGHENVGVIEEIGEKAASIMEANGIKLKKGDLVVPVCDVYCGKCYFCKNSYGYPWCENKSGYGTSLSCRNPPHLFGGWSEYMYLLPNVYVFKVPPSVPPEIAVLTEPLAVALAAIVKAYLPNNALDVGGFSIGDTIVIQGLGPIGVIHALLAKIGGASKIIMTGTGSESDRYRAELIKQLDFADEIVNLPDSSKRVRRVLELTDTKGCDLGFECTGNPSAVPEGLEMLRAGGTYLLVGSFADVGVMTLNPTIHIVGKGARIIGINGAPYQDYGKALKILKRYKDKIKIEKIVTHKFKLENVKEAMETALSKKCLKVVIAP